MVAQNGRNGGVQWRVKGYDLGLETRSVTGEIDVQGKFRVNLGYDGLRRNRSDTYQTPFNGTGTNILTLPGTWLVPTVAGSSGTNTAVNNVSARGLTGASVAPRMSAPPPIRRWAHCSCRQLHRWR